MMTRTQQSALFAGRCVVCAANESAHEALHKESEESVYIYCLFIYHNCVNRYDPTNSNAIFPETVGRKRARVRLVRFRSSKLDRFRLGRSFAMLLRFLSKKKTKTITILVTVDITIIPKPNKNKKTQNFSNSISLLII